MKTLFLAILAFPFGTYAQDTAPDWKVAECSHKPTDLREAILVPTQDQVVPYGNGNYSRRGLYQTTLARYTSTSNISNRFAANLKNNEDLHLDPNTTSFAFQKYGHRLGEVYFKSLNRKPYLFYCGVCVKENRNVKLADVLTLKNSDGTDFFKVMCRVRPKNIIVPASNTETAPETQETQPIDL